MNKKPLNTSISIFCLSFILFICLVISFVNYHSFNRALYERYNNYLTDVLRFIESNIDTDDLYECMLTNTKSENYNEVQQLMNDILDTGNVHYLYIVTPLDIEKYHTCLTLMTGMTKEEILYEYDQQNFLGDIFDDFPIETVRSFAEAMKTPGQISFEKDTESTIWGFDYTGMLPLTTSDGTTFTVLAADLSISNIYKTLWKHLLLNVVLTLGIGFLFYMFFIFWAKHNITKPIRLLEESVVQFARTSHNLSNPDLLIYNQPVIHTGNEVEALSDAVTKMADDIKAYAKNIVEAENKISNLKESASKLGMIAYQDALTHVKNKAAYDIAISKLNEKIANKKAEFGLVMIDLNCLKHINDIYGHENGNIYIVSSCSVICTIFTHSPVFRIGGDEFVVILENTDFNFHKELMQAFEVAIEGYAIKTDCKPWERISMASGLAIYDPKIDEDVNSVFERADKLMYENKQKMKALMAQSLQEI